MTRIIIAILPVLVLASCVDGDPTPAGLSDDIEAPAGMRTACVAQAARLTGMPATDILTRPAIETGGGPFIGLTVAGASYGCRPEPDGSVTVFSQFAN